MRYSRLSSDESFDFEVLRVLAHARYEGADIAEVLQAAATLEPGNFNSYYTVWNDLATRIHGQADGIDAAKNPVSARDAYFRAATYYRSADFYLHGNPNDPRIGTLWDLMTTCFDRAIALLPVPGRRFTLKGPGFDIPAIYYPAAPVGQDKPRPTVIMGSGFDGAQEENMHLYGLAALQRGYNVITYEGPGQPLVRRAQAVGFTHEWEKVVSPVVDYLFTLPEVDTRRISLLGISMGGYLCLRAAAFEHRLAATVALDGIHSFLALLEGMMPPDVMAAYRLADADQVNKLVSEMMGNQKTPAKVRWAIEHGLWSFCVETPFELFKQAELMTIDGIADRIQCPVMVCEASEDLFSRDQPTRAKQAIGDRAVLIRFTSEDSASLHCHLGATAFANQKIYDWLAEIMDQI